ncbi:hypothetical protein BaRGS_00014621 [Batillaria attramentaria]|uniref:Uncharacterized protein n=1 Tax=Batillaria attramentaria TaxID=370345 RepID=A0ABD0L4K9_9CAEN
MSNTKLNHFQPYSNDSRSTTDYVFAPSRATLAPRDILKLNFDSRVAMTTDSKVKCESTRRISWQSESPLQSFSKCHHCVSLRGGAGLAACTSE